MNDHEILAELVKDNARVALEGQGRQKRVILNEQQTPDSKATISHLPDDTVVMKVDTFTSPDQVFKGLKGECRRADYVIVSPSKKTIIYIEMKRTKDTWPGIVQQLKGAECFVKYCQEIGKSFWGENSFLEQYRHRFVSLCHTSISKRSTRTRPLEKLHDRPEDAMRIDWPKVLYFNQLAGA